MSSNQEPVETENKNSRRRRAPGSGGQRKPRRSGPPKEGNANGTKATSNSASAAEKPSTAERKPRPEAVPIPESLIGKKSTGKVVAILRRGKSRFGFILIGATKERSETVLPRVYFNVTNTTDSNLVLRRNYLVEFTCSKDEQGRVQAVAIALTAEGKQAAEEAEAAFNQRVAARQAAGTDKPNSAASSGSNDKSAPRAKRAPRVRKPVEERNIFLKITCDGKAGEKRIEFNASQSVGKLKNVAVTEFDAPITHCVYHVTSEHPEGVFLTKAVLNTLASDAKIHLGPQREEKA